MTREKEARSFGTHSGAFHADEVTACALLIILDLVDRDKIYRTRDASVHSRCEFVCDVGGSYEPDRKLFDHHQVDYTGTLSSAGMVLNWLCDTGKLAKKETDYLRRNLVDGVDAHDIGQSPQIPGVCTFSHIIAQYNPISYDATSLEQDAAFGEALDFTIGLLSRHRRRYLYVHSCRSIVADAMKSKEKCLMFDKALPWLEPFFELGGEQHPAQFVIMPTGEHWKLRGVPPSYEDRMNVRTPLPMEWAGLLENDLGRVCHIPGAIFCHKGRFISIWETREAALEALAYTLKKLEH